MSYKTGIECPVPFERHIHASSRLNSRNGTARFLKVIDYWKETTIYNSTKVNLQQKCLVLMSKQVIFEHPRMDKISNNLYNYNFSMASTNVGREIGQLLSFIYFFGRVACQCC